VSSNNYQIYINQTLQLAETIVIKSSYAAEALNRWVEGVSGYRTAVDPDPKTWKYYLNLAGEYHSIDRPMTIVSVDTLEEILFTKDNLQIHRATARAYQYGTRQYTELVQKYRDQEQLILSILYPTDIEKAIKAKDGEILSYPPGLVEENEYTLIPRLQNWIDHYKQRWYIPGFNYTDELYSATMLGEMYLLLVQAILTERTAACNTHEAHSFHIRQYLGSHGHLDTYMDTMTKKQALYFYRNIAYIERHAGRNSTFDKLTEHIMTERSIPLAEFTMKHDVRDQAENLYPEVVFRKRQLNMGIVLPENNKTSIAAMLVKSEPLAIANADAQEETAKEIQVMMENSPSNVVATKALESAMVDETNSSPWVLNEILFNQWLHLSSRDLYVAYINISNPISGEKIPLTAKEAFVLAMYAMTKSIGHELVEVPLAYASRVQRIPTPTVADIHSIVDAKIVPRKVAEAALSEQPVIAKLLSIDAFYNLGVAIDKAVQMQRRLIALQENYEARGMVQAMVTRIYSDHILRLEPEGTLYANWLSSRNIDLSEFTPQQFELLYTDIVSQATGIALNPTQSLKEIQRNMVNMFTQLSSYGIHVIAEITDGSIRKTDWPGVRLGKADGELRSHTKNPSIGAHVDRVGQATFAGIEMDMNSPTARPEVRQHSAHRAEGYIGLNGDMEADPTVYRIRAPLPSLEISAPAPDVTIPRGWVPFVGIEYFLKLSQEELGRIEDIYNPGTIYTPPSKVALEQAVMVIELPGIWYWPVGTNSPSGNQGLNSLFRHIQRSSLPGLNRDTGNET
jgi:hypothetical protein